MWLIRHNYFFYSLVINSPNLFGHTSFTVINVLFAPHFSVTSFSFANYFVFPVHNNFLLSYFSGFSGALEFIFFIYVLHGISSLIFSLIYCLFHIVSSNCRPLLHLPTSFWILFIFLLFFSYFFFF
jgi:hypothetical protein